MMESQVPSLSSEDICHSVNKLPPFSPAVRQLLGLLEKGCADVNALADQLLSDPILLGRVLQMANSSFYGFSREISTAQEACVILGNHTLRNLAYTLSVMDQFKQAKESVCDYARIWHHSLLVGCLQMRMVNLAGMSVAGMDEEQAFTSGLFHELGIIVLDYFYPKEFAECVAWARSNAVPLLVAEQKFFGLNHYRISALALEYWHFPKEIVTVLKELDRKSGAVRKSTHLLRICDVLALGMGAASLDDLPMGGLDDVVLADCGLDGRMIETALEEGRKIFDELVEQLLS